MIVVASNINKNVLNFVRGIINLFTTKFQAFLVFKHWSCVIDLYMEELIYYNIHFFKQKSYYEFLLLMLQNLEK